MPLSFVPVERERELLSIIRQEPLTVENMKTMAPLTERYVIPYNQSKSKRYGLVLDNTPSRPGAKEEADCMEQSLKTAGFDVIRREWFNVDELQSIIDKALYGIKDDCSLLTVCLMSHGRRGDEGQEIPISRILDQFTYILPEYVPMVSDERIQSVVFVYSSSTFA